MVESQVAAAVFDTPDRPFQLDSQVAHRSHIGTQSFSSESATDLGSDHPDTVWVPVKDVDQLRLVQMRVLRRAPYSQEVGTAVVGRDYSSVLHGSIGYPLRNEITAHDFMGFAERVLQVVVGFVQANQDVGPGVLVQDDLALQGFFQVYNNGQRLIVDTDQVHSIPRQVHALGYHNGYRFAHVPTLSLASTGWSRGSMFRFD